MASVVIAGAQWGDEGKGKVVDVLTSDAELVVRYQGGHNAGHTVVIGDTQYILHMMPSGILHEGTVAAVGNGTVVEPGALLREIDELRARGIRIGDNFLLSRGAHLIMPYHIALDAANERRRGKAKIGTTGRGIGPAYVDKVARVGLVAGDMLYPDLFREKLECTLSLVNETLEKIYGDKPFSVDEIHATYMAYAERLAPHIADVSIVTNRMLDAGKNVLFEGAQGTLLDIDHGTYPYVTSSSATVGGVCTGVGVGPTRIETVLGVVKAYTTRVGSGPFPTEQENEIGAYLQKKGGEFGATTGRPRRCGWLDMVALRHSVRVNGFTGIVLTKLDILSGMKDLKICTAYEMDGKRIEDFPGDAVILEKCVPVYGKTMPGWEDSTSGITEYAKLPANARAYIEAIEDMLDVPVDIVSTGARRDEIIMRKHAFRG